MAAQQVRICHELLFSVVPPIDPAFSVPGLYSGCLGIIFIKQQHIKFFRSDFVVFPTALRTGAAD